MYRYESDSFNSVIGSDELLFKSFGSQRSINGPFTLSVNESGDNSLSVYRS